MGDLENKKESGSRCLIIAVVVIVILNLVFFFRDTSSNDIAGLGATLLCFVGMFVGYYIIKQFSSSDDSSGNDSYGSEKKQEQSFLKGCLLPIGVVLFILLMGGLFMSSNEMNYSVGILLVFVLAIGLGVWLYNTFKDKD